MCGDLAVGGEFDDRLEDRAQWRFQPRLAVVGPGPGADDHVEPLVEARDQRRDRLHRVGAIRVADDDRVVGRSANSILQRAAIADVVGMPQHLCTGLFGKLAGAVGRTIVDNDDLIGSELSAVEGRLGSINGFNDAVALVERRNDD
ncbi:hypothetical protein AB7M75_003837 [Bradyrhizobium ottawaense]